VHEQQLDVLGVLNEEDSVAGGDHVLCLFVAAVADLLFKPDVSSQLTGRGVRRSDRRVW
jgi:hypothetical protein